MRVINLDETGIKLITSNSKQIYLTAKDVKDFIEGKYTIDKNTLKINKKELSLPDQDLEHFDDTFDYIKVNFGESV